LQRQLRSQQQTKPRIPLANCHYERQLLARGICFSLSNEKSVSSVAQNAEKADSLRRFGTGRTLQAVEKLASALLCIRARLQSLP
jgi:hypothetical protein